VTLALTGLALVSSPRAATCGKRLEAQVRAKDASNLLPGHGCFMERVDGLVTAAIAAAVLAWLINAAPPAAPLVLGQ
jgi:phosphatidate cytidylyltransferase